MTAANDELRTAAASNRNGACFCPPCPGRGYDGHRMAHCAECCFGTGVEAHIDCPRHGDPTVARAWNGSQT